MVDERASRTYAKLSDREDAAASFPFIMPEPLPARIRAYAPSDEKEVRFMVGQAQMESLAYANHRCTGLFFFRVVQPDHDPPSPLLPAYFHPVTLAIWIAISSVFAQYMDWWPNSTHGILSWLQVLPAFFAPAVPVMFFIDW
jgi:hypothetical protein